MGLPSAFAPFVPHNLSASRYFLGHTLAVEDGMGGVEAPSQADFESKVRGFVELVKPAGTRLAAGNP